MLLFFFRLRSRPEDGEPSESGGSIFFVLRFSVSDVEELGLQERAETEMSIGKDQRRRKEVVK